MKFVKVSIQTLALVAASLLAEEAPQNPSNDASEKLREYLAQNDTASKPDVDPKEPKKPKRMCCVSVI